ncbi:MAG: hypothetical protein ACXADH_15985 [Candidatus Kariarchaeaceae archaeon]|jgi:hypothetical protein
MFKRILHPPLVFIAVTIGVSIIVLLAIGARIRTNRPERRIWEGPSQQEIHQLLDSQPYKHFLPIVSKGINTNVGSWKTIPFTDCPRIFFIIKNYGDGLHLENFALWDRDCRLILNANEDVPPSHDECKVFFSRLTMYRGVYEGCDWEAHKGFLTLYGEFTSPTYVEGIVTLTDCDLFRCNVLLEFPWTAEYLP